MLFMKRLIFLMSIMGFGVLYAQTWTDVKGRELVADFKSISYNGELVSGVKVSRGGQEVLIKWELLSKASQDLALELSKSVGLNTIKNKGVSETLFLEKDKLLIKDDFSKPTEAYGLRNTVANIKDGIFVAQAPSPEVISTLTKGKKSLGEAVIFLGIDSKTQENLKKGYVFTADVKFVEPYKIEGNNKKGFGSIETGHHASMMKFTKDGYTFGFDFGSKALAPSIYQADLDYDTWYTMVMEVKEGNEGVTRLVGHDAIYAHDPNYSKPHHRLVFAAANYGQVHIDNIKVFSVKGEKPEWEETKVEIIERMKK